MSHHWSGPFGVPGGLERWQHGSYRWRRGLEAALVVALIIVTAPWMVEIAVGAALMALGLLWLAWSARPRRRRHRFDLLALLVAVLALLEARRSRYR